MGENPVRDPTNRKHKQQHAPMTALQCVHHAVHASSRARPGPLLWHQKPSSATTTTTTTTTHHCPAAPPPRSLRAAGPAAASARPAAATPVLPVRWPEAPAHSALPCNGRARPSCAAACSFGCRVWVHALPWSGRAPSAAACSKSGKQHAVCARAHHASSWHTPAMVPRCGCATIQSIPDHLPLKHRPHSTHPPPMLVGGPRHGTQPGRKLPPSSASLATRHRGTTHLSCWWKALGTAHSQGAKSPSGWKTVRDAGARPLPTLQCKGRVGQIRNC